MNNLIITTLVLNILTLSGIFSASIISKKSKKPAFIALYTTFTGVILTLYLLALLVLFVYKIIDKNYISSLITLFFICSPFVVGNIATYKRAGFYINLQMFLLALSLFCLLRHII